MSEELEKARRFVLANLPSTFNVLQARGREHNIEWRKIDAAIQSLRKRGFIAFERKGRDCVWSVAGQSTDATQ